jgi:outer membrane lipoprotein SlyB
MRKILIAVTAATLTVPAALPTAAVAQGYSQRAQNYDGPTWRGRDGRTYCRRSNGTTGLIVGGAAGALIGRELDGGRSRTTGTVLGAAVGALLGREVERSRSARRCR